ELAPRDFAFRVLAPLARDELAVFGDLNQFATAGDRRIRDLRASGRGVELDVLGAPGGRVTISGWSARPLAGVPVQPGTGRFGLQVAIRDRGWIRVALR